MRTIYKYIYSVLAVAAAGLMCTGCVEYLEEDICPPSDHLAFKVSLNDGGSPAVTKGLTGTFDFEEEEWELEGMSVKAEHYSSLNGLSAGLYGYLYSGQWSDNIKPIDEINDSEYAVDGDQMDAKAPVKWSAVEKKAGEGSLLRVYAYAPKEAIVPAYEHPTAPEGESQDDYPCGAPVLDISDVFAKDAEDAYIYQSDILAAHADIALDMDEKTHRKEIPLDFEHIYTAIRFRNGFGEGCTITGVEISGIITGGRYVMGEGWSKESATMSENPVVLAVSEQDEDDYIFVIPQRMETGSEAEIVVKYTDAEGEKQVSASLAGVEWRQGKRITYTLRKEQKYIYLDLAAGNVTVTGTDGSAKYEGKVFVGQSEEVEGVAKTISGYIGEGQELYVYQSCITAVNNKETAVNGKRNYKVGWSAYDDDNQQGTGQFTLPSYPQVRYDGRLWSDYITDNIDVQGVIEAWDNEAGAGKASTESSLENAANGDGSKGAVRDAGREATKNRIHIEGDIGNVKMIIDNIYSSYQERTEDIRDGNYSEPIRYRTTGGISFLPDQKGSNSTLTIHILGDNRLGCVNYQNYKNKDLNYLVFEGSGSLTVGDTDYYRDSGGLGSNRSCSVIGGKDLKTAEEDVYNIEFNSGVIYAGATTSTCTAIGGGGNGNTRIVINGGTITAVAKSTGAAIGGGTGLVDPGGEGEVTINDGNVYAYNFKNASGIPSSAIGAAGSRAAKGGVGSVNINGGYVYAFSEYGTAIGGGSSAQRHGGKGVIKISGGTVIAKTGDPDSAGIGGGSSYTVEYKPLSTTNPIKNGGDAEIEISGNPIIRTGSIGGGTPGKGETKGGKIGSAQISVTGGDIQAQFVMADSPDNEFTMSAGVIRNSATSDKEYYCVQENGGAVYMEKGKFTMTGGTIKECYADKTSDAKGGAVYIKGDEDTKFEMKGGSIEMCRASADGGAVYLEGGSVEVTGGSIIGNVAYNGNGGAISILGGNFTMNGADALISQNAAFNSSGGKDGNGGGIYIAPSEDSSSDIKVQLTKGKITSNSSDRNGGGVCVDMGSDDVAGLSVTVGEVSDAVSQGDEQQVKSMFINENNAQVKGGGMYVNGSSSTDVMLYDGEILYNGTSSYQVNQDIAVDGGLVSLMKPGITTQVTITFSNNAQYYTQGVTADEQMDPQYVVASARSKLNESTFTAFSDYYDTFKGWNTRRDGKGTSYADGQVYSFDESITLYAQWE